MRDAATVDVSVVITTRNRADLLKASLDTLGSMDSPSFAWELLVVDNGSNDHTRNVLEQAKTKLPLEILTVARAGKTRAQNVAVAHARGKLVAFTDDDVVFDPAWLNELASAAERWPDASVFGGQIEIALPSRVPEWLQSSEMRPLLERLCARYAPRVDEGETDQAPLGPNMAIRACALTDVRFDENVGPDGTHDYIKGGDTDLCHVLAERGHRFVYVPKARIIHHVREGQLELSSIIDGMFRRGRKNAYLNPKPAKILIAHAPISLWFALARQWLRYVACWSLSTHTRYKVGSKLFFRRGYLYQYRLQQKALKPGQRS